MRWQIRTAIVFAAVSLVVAACGGTATPDENGEVVITMTEFAFEPNRISVSPGQTVTFVLLNDGDKEHEFMVGRDVRVTDGISNGFEHDFFEGMAPTVVPPHAEVMNMGDEEMGDGEMSDGEMSDGEMGDMEEGDHVGHTGFMVAREPGEQASVTITIPADASGEWTIGCFEEDGAHWDDGMRATLVIES